MRQVYHKSPQGNFGDDLNVWFWDEVLPGWRDWDESVTLVGIGTILNAGLLPPGRKLVVGSGVGYGNIPDISDGDMWDIRAVRGPRTAEALGLDASKAISDPAIILPCLDRFRDIEKNDDIVFVPHVGSDQSFDWAAICDRLGLQYQSPSAPPEVVITRLASASGVIAESMHAAIIADAFGTPWTAVRISNGFNCFKWLDWAESLSIQDIEIKVFFSNLRKLQSISRTGMRSGSLSAITDQSARSGQHCPRRKGYTLHFLAYLYLKKVSKKRNAYITDRIALKKAQQKYFQVFHEIRKDYG